MSLTEIKSNHSDDDYEVNQMDKDSFLLADIMLSLVYISSILLPFITINLMTSIGKVSTNTIINPAIINGIITLSGILFGFATAAILRKGAPIIVYIMLLVNLLIFYYVAVEIFFATIGIGSWLGALTRSVASLLSNFIVAGALLGLDMMNRIQERKRKQETVKSGSSQG